MDIVFDILNSKSAYGRFSKSPLRPDNMAEQRKNYDNFRKYILSIQDSSGQPLYRGRRKTFIVGFINTFHAVLMLAEELFSSGLKYLPTFRISQDFIETLFSKIRRMGGHNSNPTCVLFKAALKKLLCKQFVQGSNSANALEADSNSGIFSLKWSKRTAPVPTVSDISLSNDLVEKLQHLETSTSNIVRDNIVTYVAGYVVRSLLGSVKCEACAEALVGKRGNCVFDHDYQSYSYKSTQLLNIKDRGGLVAASQSVNDIIKRCESIMERYVDQKFLRKDNHINLLVALLFRSVIVENPTLLFTHSCELGEGSLDHSKQLIREIARKYFDIRIKHYVKHYNKTVIHGSKGKDRSKLSRLVIFKHL
jgi:hypothetical protein